MALGQRPRLPQPLYSQLCLTHILNTGGILVGQFFGSVREAAVQQLSSAKRWSPDNTLSTYLTGDHLSSF